MSVVPDRAVVAVTGASGFIGSFIVKELLARGFQVRACVRNKDDPEKTEHLRALTREPLCTGTLSLYSADLTHPGSYDDAFRGADAVIHAAAVVEIRRVADPMAQVVNPSVEGTRNVLSSVDKSTTVRRFVHTSSVVAIFNLDRPSGTVFTENDW
eukprot:RCo036650